MALTPESEDGESPDGQFLSTVSKAFNVIQVLSERDGARVTEVADALGIPKSTAHCYLNTLVSEGFAVHRGDEYNVSWRFLRIGGTKRYRTRLYRKAREELKSLTMEVNELTNLIVEEAGLGVLLLRVRFPECVDDNDTIGQDHYLHTTAAGKAILAHVDDRRREQILRKQGLSAATPETITQRDRLSEELASVRERGFAVSNEENREGLSGIGCAILEPSDTVLGAISISGPSARISKERIDGELSEGIQRAKNIIELKIKHDSNTI